MNRRSFVERIAALSAAGSFLNLQAVAKTFKKAKQILVVSGWQDVNIGDIAHTPGLLHILETFIPDASVILWKRSEGKEVKDLLNKNFPKVKVIYGSVDGEGNVASQDVKDAFKSCDVMIHGSGPSVVGQHNLEAWVNATGKSFGLFGVTIGQVDDRLKKLLEKASFIYTRETASIKVLKEKGLSGDLISFAPDATFFLNLQDKDKANRFLQSNQLDKGKFICAVPRLRFTPYHKFASVNWSAEKIQEVETVNARCKEPDHAKLREAMIRWVRETGNKVLVCPEMTYQTEIMDELLINPLPYDVKPNVVKRGYWLPDEASSVYAHAFAVLSFECHSPIIASANKVPFFYLRQPEDTIKGQMYYDLGFDEWVFEIEQSTGKKIADGLMQLWHNKLEASQKVDGLYNRVSEIYSQATKNILSHT
jgi:polysaccharide pyruvyl transferase WcaK-like protein